MDDLDQALAAAFKGASAEPAPETIEAEPAPETVEAEPDATPETEPVDDSIEGLLSAGLAKAGLAAQTVTAPEHWAPADKAILARLPDDATRTAVLEWRTQVEKGAQTKFEEAAHGRTLAAELDQAFTPLGVARQDHAAAVRQLVAAEHLLRHDPIAGLAQLIGGARVAGTEQARTIIQQLAQALQVNVGGSTGQAKVDPVTERIQALERQIAAREYQDRQAQQNHLNRQVAAAETLLTNFKDAKDQSGQAVHPHYDRVRPVMAALMQAAVGSGEPLDLEGAYQRATWAQEDLRADLQKAEAAKAAKATAEARKQSVAKAKLAATPRTASVHVPATDDGDDLETLLTASYREMVA